MNATLLVTVLAVGAPGPKDKPNDHLYGLWELERTEGESRKAGPPLIGPLRYRFNEDGTYVVLDGEKERVGPRPFTFDPKAKAATIDIYTDASKGGGKEAKSLGIYKIEGDKLTLCKAYPGEKRPTEFKVPEGSSNYLMVFRRVKAKE